jgi:hypothetical protein
VGEGEELGVRAAVTLHGCSRARTLSRRPGVVGVEEINLG